MPVPRPFLTAFLLSVLCIFDLSPGIARASAQFACAADITGDGVADSTDRSFVLGASKAAASPTRPTPASTSATSPAAWPSSENRNGTQHA
jgi:hypothetical protein